MRIADSIAGKGFAFVKGASASKKKSGLHLEAYDCESILEGNVDVVELVSLC